MWQTLFFVFLVVGLMCQAGHTQEAKTVLEGVAKILGATELKSLHYTGSGSTFAPGQSVVPGAPWPRFNAKSYTRTINYDTMSMQDEILRTQAENPPAVVVDNPWSASSART